MFNIDKYNSKKYKEGSKRGLRGKAILNLSKKSKKSILLLGDLTIIFLSYFFSLVFCAVFFFYALKRVKYLFFRTSLGSYGYATFRVSGAKLCAVRVACIVGLVNAFQHCLVRGVDIHKSRVIESLEKAYLPYGQCGGVDKSVVDKIRSAVNCYLGA